ncbi:hypothetical protein ACS0TY_034336 [Phlomoides rotata]
MGLNVDRENLAYMADILGCEVGVIHFFYLGLNVGINNRQAASWDKLVDKIRRRLALWNDKHISLEGRITLIQAVLSAVLIYCLSFYRLPRKTLREIVQIQRKFIWGVCEDSSKIPWVIWEDICKKKENGGLGIRNLERFNFALVSKWAWRFLNESNCLWAKVIKSKCGSLGPSGGSCFGRCRVAKSGWWKDVCEFFVGGEGGGMREDCEIMMGNGNKTSFWLDRWIEGKSLKSKFGRLFRIIEQQEAVVSQMGFLGEDD